MNTGDVTARSAWVCVGSTCKSLYVSSIGELGLRRAGENNVRPCAMTKVQWVAGESNVKKSLIGRAGHETFNHSALVWHACYVMSHQSTGVIQISRVSGEKSRPIPSGPTLGSPTQNEFPLKPSGWVKVIKVTHNTCSLHLVSNFQNSSKHTKPSIENSTSLW